MPTLSSCALSLNPSLLLLLATWPAAALGLRAGRWTVNVTKNGNIDSVLAEGADLTLKGRGVCPGMAHSPESLHGLNAPVVINARTGEVHACALAARCKAPDDSATRRSFCYNLGGAFGSSGQLQVFYNVTLLQTSARGSGFKLFQDVQLDVTGSDANMVLILQLPMPVQPNKLVGRVHFAESRLADGRPLMRQVGGKSSGGPWAGEFPMSESAFSEVGENSAGLIEHDRLALPMVVTSAPSVKLRTTHVADPYYSTAFLFAGDESGDACWQSVYNSSKSSLNGSGTVKVSRRFATVVHGGEAWTDDIDAWYEAVLPQVQAPPEWTRKIALSHFDFFTKNGSSWRTEIDWLANRLSPMERDRVVLAQEGWYDTQGDYSFDPASDTFLDSWTFAPASPFWVPSSNGTSGHWNCSWTDSSCDAAGNPKIWAAQMNVDRVRESLKYARSRGFRTLLYFGDGLLVCKKAKTYDSAHTLPDNLFQYMATHMADCACPPEMEFCNSVQNPLHPRVFEFYIKYLKGLLRAFGDVIDGFVWDETFYITPEPALVDAAGGYASTAMLRLVEELTRIVYDYDPQMVFMASDMGIDGSSFVPYGVVASGQFPDFEVQADMVPALLATAGNRAAIWSCNWEPTLHLPKTVAAAYAYGLPPSLGMTYHTSQFPNVGISGMTTRDSDTILRLVRYLTKQENNTATYI